MGAVMRYLIGLLLCVALLVPGCAPERVTHTAAGEPIVPQTAHAPTIDGVLDEAEWAHAAVIGPFVGPIPPVPPAVPVPGATGATDLASKPEYQTHARLLWDASHLYIAFVCHGGDAHTDRTKHNDEIYKQDTVEAFIDVVGDMRGYAELQGNPVGATGSYLHTWGSPPDYSADKIDWSQVTKHHHGDDKWVLDGFVNASKPIVAGGKTVGWISEWSVPMSEILSHRGLASRLHEGQVIKANLMRFEYPASPLDAKGQPVLHQFSWSPTVKGCPHVSPMAMRGFVLGR
jgi:hypothetical protein